MDGIPNTARTVIAALHFMNPQRERLRALARSEWEELLPLCDRLRLTLPLRQICADNLPQWVRSRIDQNIQNNTERFGRIKQVYREVASILEGAGVEHLVLKGFALWPSPMQATCFRTQSDIDIFCPPSSVLRAKDALLAIGYESVKGLEHQPTDHLPQLVRKTDWKWRGDYFDPDIPISLEFHFRFWNETTTRLRPKGTDQFWGRRVERSWGDLKFPALHPADSLGYAALHVLHHLLFGGLIPYHVYELAWFLHSHAEDERFWENWLEFHDISLRRLEAVAFRLATDWFGCRLPRKIESDMQSLSRAVQQWFCRYHDSPLNALICPNKDQMWLHLSLLESFSDKSTVFCSTLLPVRLPPTGAVKQWPIRNYLRFLVYALKRVAHHLYVLPSTLGEGARWWWFKRKSNAPNVQESTALQNTFS